MDDDGWADATPIRKAVRKFEKELNISKEDKE